MGQYEVVFYETANGTKPALEYISSLPPKMRARIYKIASLLEEIGPQLRMPYSEHLKDGIFQIRAQQEGNISRILYFFAIGKTIVLTNGFKVTGVERASVSDERICAHTASKSLTIRKYSLRTFPCLDTNPLARNCFALHAEQFSSDFPRGGGSLADARQRRQTEKRRKGPAWSGAGSTSVTLQKRHSGPLLPRLSSH